MSLWFIALGLLALGAAFPAAAANYACIRELRAEPPAAREARQRLVAVRRAGPIIIVHRGASAMAPENSLEAFAAAMDYGADGCEVDLRRTRDGVLVLFHDDMLVRLRATESAPALIAAFRRVDPELERIADSQWAEYPLVWRDARFKMVLLPAFGELRGPASKKFLLEYVAMNEARASELAPPQFEEATRALLRHDLTLEELKALLRHPNSAVGFIGTGKMARDYHLKM